jgi:hypothetical protein
MKNVFVSATEKQKMKEIKNVYKKCGSYWIHVGNKNKSTFICPRGKGKIWVSNMQGTAEESYGHVSIELP